MNQSINNHWSKALAVIGFFSFSVFSCGDDDSTNGGTDPTDPSTFDRSAMLAHWADNIIVPAYQAFGAEVDAMKTASDNFEANPNETNFNTLKEEWEDAYIAWQRVALFITGPSDDIFFVNDASSFINTYPTNTVNIDDFISTGTYNLSSSATTDEQGFPALDYLLFGLADTDAEILALYTSNPNATNYLNYLTDIVDRINTLTDQVVTEWEGDYRDTFVASSGSSITSSTDRTVNDYLRYYELILRNGKIGIPAGVSSQGAGNTVPRNVEALYKGDLSKTLYLEALDAFQGFFRGTPFNGGANGESLESYLDFLSTTNNGQNLSTLINNQFNDTRAVAETLDDSFFNQINTNNTPMLTTYEEMQNNVVYLKSDMFSALDIQLIFNSGDGD